ncbi:RING finger protein [Penicillium malachiteum]|uniref:RING finger protein n=1 Tax=Penicillium malachiteum TaxID=1324776 RepID=UPI0025490A38|nr:RING finger protein [Penicillium malachiteum]KAJ5737304.1 RING finger protein [Penicillium malachiteum]
MSAASVLGTGYYHLDDIICYQDLQASALDAYLIIRIFWENFGIWFIAVLLLVVTERAWGRGSMGPDHRVGLEHVKQALLGRQDVHCAVLLLETYTSFKSEKPEGWKRRHVMIQALIQANINTPDSDAIACPDMRVSRRNHRSAWMPCSQTATHVVLFAILFLCNVMSTPYNRIRQHLGIYSRFYHGIRELYSFRKTVYEKYPDATTEKVGSDGICIICQEEMDLIMPAVNGGEAGFKAALDVRNVSGQFSPKLLPCGRHVLHFDCLCIYLLTWSHCPICQTARPVPAKTSHIILRWWVMWLWQYQYRSSL